MSKFKVDIEWCENVATIDADAMINAKLIAKSDFERARNNAKKEILVATSQFDCQRKG